MAYIAGRNIIVATVSGTTVTPIAAAKSCDVETNCNLKPVSSPSSGDYLEYKADRKTWTVVVNHLLMSTGTPVLNTKNIGTRYYLKIYTAGNSSTDKIEGYAYLRTAKVTGTVGNLAQGSWAFQGSGSLM